MSAKPFIGYNFAGPIDGSAIPQRLQNLCIREYAASKKLPLSFCAAEYFDSGKSLMLFGQFEHSQKIAGFIFYSFLLLPSVPERRREFYSRVAAARMPVHFAIEDLCLSSDDTPDLIERMYRISLDHRIEDTRAKLVELKTLKPG